MRLALPLLLALLRIAGADDAVTDRASSRNLAGSVQLDYLALPQQRNPTPDQGFAGATVELSTKLAMDFGKHTTANVKVCFACHGFELGMAFFDIRIADELAIRVGRFTPAFGSFPLRHDPANHSTSDKPLAYDMGRMVRFRDWNEGVLPAPWVDNGVELNGTHFFSSAQLDYAAYAINGPKGDSGGFDFDYKQSRSGERYYVDNNGEPTLGARASATIDLGPRQLLSAGASGMIGHYDPEGRLGFLIAGADASLQLGRTFVRTEYLARWTQFAIGSDPTRLKYATVTHGDRGYTFRDGFDVELEQPLGPVTAIARFDGLRRAGNLLATSELRSRSIVLRYTVGVAVPLGAGLQLKTSAELYDFTDFDDELALHVGIAGPF